MAKDKQINEERTVGASYIVNFYAEINILTTYYAQYLNLLLELDTRYSADYLGKMPENEKTTLKQALQMVREEVVKTYVQYTAIIRGSGTPADTSITKYYEEIKKDFVIKREVLENYVLALNLFITDKVIRNLLESSQDLLDKLYKENEQQ